MSTPCGIAIKTKKGYETIINMGDKIGIKKED